MAAESENLWDETGVDPVEIHLGKDSGYTLRAYRMSDTLPGGESTDQAASEEDEERPEIGDRPEDEEANEAPDDAEFEDELDVLDAVPEEVPVFLTRKGKLQLFRDVESLVKYVRESDDNDLAAIDEYGDLQKRLTAADVVCDEDDIYELDLVTTNLRGGHDAWDPELLIKAAEIGRDLGYALRNTSVIEALAPGSPLDDLDEALRAILDGGLRGMFARRRLRKIGSEQAAIAWRAVIAKINHSAEWHGESE